jgi:hypothetical protein
VAVCATAATRRAVHTASSHCDADKNAVASASKIETFVAEHSFRIGEGAGSPGKYLFHKNKIYVGGGGSAPASGQWEVHDGTLCLIPVPGQQYCWREIKIATSGDCMVSFGPAHAFVVFHKVD